MAKQPAKRKPKPATNASYYFFPRDSEVPSKPAGYTVSKRPELPQGYFGITEFIWGQNGHVALWFVDADRFTADERQAAYFYFLKRMGFKHA